MQGQVPAISNKNKEQFNSTVIIPADKRNDKSPSFAG